MSIYSECAHQFMKYDSKAVRLWTQSLHEKHVQTQRDACLTMFECLESGDYIEFANALDRFWSTHL